MDHIVHHAGPEAIGQSSSPASDNSYAKPKHFQHWTDEHWQELGIRPNIGYRMARIDRALQGLWAIHQLQAINFAATQEEEVGENSGLLRLTGSQQDGLNAAAWSLHCDAARAIENLRDNLDNCWGTP